MVNTINGVKSNYIINEPKKSNTYRISYAGPNKDLNSKILRGIVDGIKEHNLREKKNVYKLSINFIDSRISKLKIKIDSLNSVISDFKISNGVYMPAAQTNSVLNNLNEIEQKIFKNKLQSELSVKLLNEVEKQNSFELLPTDIGIENENINEMVSQFNKIILEKNNFIQYEISNFGKENYFSNHNSNYWKGIEYIGLGPSAHSFDGVSRQWNISNNSLYIKNVTDKNEAYFEKEILLNDLA